MPTPEQLAANQANAQKSTGPTSEAGKAASSQNSYRHGLFGVFRVLAIEDQAQYNRLLEELLQEHRPTTPTEGILVERMAQHHWLSHRAVYFQAHYIQSGDDINMAKVSLFMRYESMHERALHKCLHELLKLRAERRKEENGFVSQTHKQELHRVTLLGREADLQYRAARAAGAQSQRDHQKNRLNQPVSEPIFQPDVPKAA